MVIWKYEIPIQDDFTLELPDESEVLHVALQNGKPYAWVLLHDINAPKKERMFHIIGTGNPFDEKEGYMMYIGTFQMPPFVWHLWERSSLIPEDF